MKKLIAAILAIAMMATPVYANEEAVGKIPEDAGISGYSAVAISYDDDDGNSNSASILQKAKAEGKTQDVNLSISNENYEISVTDLYIDNFKAYISATGAVSNTAFEANDNSFFHYWFHFSPDRSQLEEIRESFASAEETAVTLPAPEYYAEPAPRTDWPEVSDDELMSALKMIPSASTSSGGTGTSDGGNYTMETFTTLDSIPEKLYMMIGGVYIANRDETSYPIEEVQEGKVEFATTSKILQRDSQVTVQLMVDLVGTPDFYLNDDFYPTGIKLQSGLIAPLTDGNGFLDEDNMFVQEYIFTLPAGNTSLEGAELVGMQTNTVVYEPFDKDAEIYEIAVDASKVVHGGDFEVINREVTGPNGKVILDTIQFNQNTIDLSFFVKGSNVDGLSTYHVEGDEFYPIVRLVVNGEELRTVTENGVGYTDYNFYYHQFEYLREDQVTEVEIQVLKPDKTYEIIKWSSME